MEIRIPNRISGIEIDENEYYIVLNTSHLAQSNSDDRMDAGISTKREVILVVSRGSRIN